MFPHRVKFFKAYPPRGVSQDRQSTFLTVHPVPAPVSTSAELKSNNKLTGSNQKLMLFNRGNAISDYSRLPSSKPPLIQNRACVFQRTRLLGYGPKNITRIQFCLVEGFHHVDNFNLIQPLLNESSFCPNNIIR